MRAVAWANRVCIMSTITGAEAAVSGIKALRKSDYQVRSLQSYVKKSVANV
jgi:carbamoyl-phosphate synthase large subunit